MTYQRSRLEAVQLALFDKDFNISDRDMRFVDQLLANGEKKAEAMRTVRPNLSMHSAGVRAAEALRKPEVLRYLDWRRAQMVLRAELTQDEVIAKARRVYHAGMGDFAVPYTPPKAKDGEYIMARMPNLSAANTAVETLRKVGQFGGDTVDMRVAAAVARVESLADEDAEARLEELALAAGIGMATPEKDDAQ